MSSKALFESLVSQIIPYEKAEAKEIVFWLLEHYLNLRKVDIIFDKTIDNQTNIDWKNIIERLNAHEPIQYILGKTTFFGRRFLVDDSVLIPRPETEELVSYVIRQQSIEASRQQDKLSILDIGTGSGCIAISLAAELPHAEVSAFDISEKALATAQKNAELNSVNVNFQKVDILRFLDENESLDSRFSIIVSNPPYITKSEASQMRKNVLDFEPHLALFVEDKNPLIFYAAIAKFASKHLQNNGLLATEINETLGESTAKVFEKHGFMEVKIIKDIHKKDRFVVGLISRFA